MNNVSHVTLRCPTLIMSVTLLSGELQEIYVINVSHVTLRRATIIMSVMLLPGELQ